MVVPVLMKRCQASEQENPGPSSAQATTIAFATPRACPARTMPCGQFYLRHDFPWSNTRRTAICALHLRLDELLRGVDAARDKLTDLENCTDEEIDRIERSATTPVRPGTD
jgi:hypothetical protein